MNRYPHEPLTSEERVLAQLTGRLGPHGEPSPALDARILAAAHAAATVEQARKPKPRWPLAMGLAASVVLAVGVAWQLRPLQQVASVSEAPAVASEAPEAAADAAAMAGPAPQADVQESGSAPEAFAKTESEPANQPAVEPPPPMRVLPPAGGAPAAAPANVARNRMPARQTDAYSPSSPPAPAPPPPPPGPTTPAPKGLIAQEPAPDLPRAFPVEADTTADMANVAEATGNSTREQASARAEMKARSAAATAKESTTLDRVEVSGSRLQRTDLQVPVSDDARLPVNDWLERVRTRYGLGDADAARQSLLLFVKDHPRESIPDDLEPLLKPLPEP